jgi:hypothetical protein
VVPCPQSAARDREWEIVKEKTTSIEVAREGSENSVVAPVIGQWAEACFPVGSPSSETAVRELLEEAAESARVDYGPDSARAWAEGYTFPAHFMESDIRCLQAAQLNFTVMVRKRLHQLSPNRLSASWVEGLRADNPERALMFDLAKGTKVHLPVGFEPNGMRERPSLRKTYVEVATAVNKMLGAVVEQRLAFLLPLDMAQRYVPGLHLCKAHWTVKKGKPSGRPLGDLSRVDGTPINTDETADAASDYYGRIVRPTIEDIAVMIHDFWIAARVDNPGIRLSDLRIWKMDLKGVYPTVV